MICKNIEKQNPKVSTSLLFKNYKYDMQIKNRKISMKFIDWIRILKSLIDNVHMLLKEL